MYMRYLIDMKKNRNKFIFWSSCSAFKYIMSDGLLTIVKYFVIYALQIVVAQEMVDFFSWWRICHIIIYHCKVSTTFIQRILKRFEIELTTRVWFITNRILIYTIGLNSIQYKYISYSGFGMLQFSLPLHYKISAKRCNFVARLRSFITQVFLSQNHHCHLHRISRHAESK